MQHIQRDGCKSIFHFSRSSWESLTPNQRWFIFSWLLQQKVYELPPCPLGRAGHLLCCSPLDLFTLYWGRISKTRPHIPNAISYMDL